MLAGVAGVAGVPLQSSRKYTDLRMLSNFLGILTFLDEVDMVNMERHDKKETKWMEQTF